MKIVGFSGGPIANALLLPNGSAATPALAFASDTDTGFYRSGANEISVSVGGTQTLRFSTSSAGVITLQNSGPFVQDNSGNEILRLVARASAVNEATITNNTTGNYPSIGATGGDTNIGFDVVGKGTGDVRMWSGSILSARFYGVASGVNFIDFTSAVTTSGPSIAANGSDTNVALNLRGKGSGGVSVGGSGGYVGFYGTTPIALQTGVAVSAAGIHAALVNLGLITA